VLNMCDLFEDDYKEFVLQSTALALISIVATTERQYTNSQC